MPLLSKKKGNVLKNALTLCQLRVACACLIIHPERYLGRGWCLKKVACMSLVKQIMLLYLAFDSHQDRKKSFFFSSLLLNEFYVKIVQAVKVVYNKLYCGG